MNISPLQAFGWTIVSCLLSLYSPSILFDFSLSISLIFLIIFISRSMKAARMFLSLSIPFFGPLFLIHGIINPQYSQSFLVWGIPIRMDGLLFALNICSNLAIFLSVAISWWHVDRDFFIDWLISRRVPTIIIGLISQASAMVPLIERRGAAVLRAQTARGLPTGPKLRHRITALPSVLLPVITSLMNEADHRSYALWSRGFGEHKFSVNYVSIGRWADLLYVFATLLLPMAVLLCE